ncbi:MAG TPA: SDR family oxidoreductase [Myxococcaceae bacterium]|nr:SDR family oxidoreductase [Myxococcaceae bacterium]
MSGSLKGRVALVTGAGQRLGKAIAEGLGALGADVAVHYCGSEAGAQDTCRTIQGLGQRAQAFQADLTEPSAPKKLVAEVEAALGPVDILINSAARFDRMGFLETPAEILELNWALTARAPFLLSQAVAPGMQAKGKGDILNVLDVAGVLMPWKGYSAHGITKAALAHLTEVLALELAPTIRVNAVAPGTVLPPEHLSSEALEKLRQRIPLGRFGRPQDIVETVGFLLTGPDFLTGQVIAVEGGRQLEHGFA